MGMKIKLLRQSWMLAAILTSSLLVSCYRDDDSRDEREQSEIEFQTQLDQAMSWAQVYGPATQSLAEEVAARHKGKASPINYKTRESAERKCHTENAGPFDLMDLARTTVICEYKSIPTVVDDVKSTATARGILGRYKHQTSDYGYWGDLFNLAFEFLNTEIQVKSYRMYYAANTEDVCRPVLGDSLYNVIHTETGVEPGGSHHFYEIMRSDTASEATREYYRQLSIEYYRHFEPDYVNQATYIPQAPDYNDATMWVTADGDTDGTGADIFYVVSTWEEDWTTEDGRTCHYADVWNADHRGRMADLEINKVAAYMSPGNRFYAPFYRHTTMEAWLTQNEDTIMNRTRLSMGDVCAAFDQFQAHRDKSRPLIIAGFSQGGLAVVELLKHIDDETYSQLAAAYVLGYKVTNADMAQCSHIRPAEGETDTGVTICYNTVKDVKYVIPVISASDICINPVNWRTDDTPATLHDTITVAVAPSHHVLVVSGYSGSEYSPYKGFLNVGDIHSCEPWLYSECLAKNIKVRAKEWRIQYYE